MSEIPETCPMCGANYCGAYLTDPWFQKYMCGSRIGGSVLDQKLDQSDACRVRELEQQLAAVTKDLVCFSPGCGIPWSPEEATKPCDCAHEENWGHEWVQKRHNEFLDKVLREREEHKQQLAAVTAERDELKKKTAVIISSCGMGTYVCVPAGNLYLHPDGIWRPSLRGDGWFPTRADAEAAVEKFGSP